MILVTGAAGFIGTRIVRALGQDGGAPVFAVDNAASEEKRARLAALEIADYLGKEAFRRRLEAGAFKGKFRAVLHQGACTNTLEQDSGYLLDNNVRYSLALLAFCQRERIPFIYASSAAVYGSSRSFAEASCNESALNKYGRSKLLFDRHVRRLLHATAGQPPAPVVGLRYFNVYGPGEAHKGRMASVPFHLYRQFAASGRVSLFGAWDGYADGEQQRDFVHVDDVVAVNRFFLDDCRASGIFNVGTGLARSFNALAVAALNALDPGRPALPLAQQVAAGRLNYVDFPDALKGSYQSCTQADLGLLRAAGYAAPFTALEQGVARYMATLGGH